jgi:hypothetical protein
MRQNALVLLLPALLACSQGNPEEAAISSPAPPPAAALAPLRGPVQLDRTLAQLEGELVRAINGVGDFNAHLIRAEAITDRLLETQMPFAWLNARRYGVEPMLRQIQSLADRILAQMRSGVGSDEVERETRAMHKRVRDLRFALRAGGGSPPLSLDSLLAAYAADSLLQIIERGGED